MNKELLELLDAINQKKVEVKNLADAGKIDEAKAAKSELQTMQDKFDLLKDLEDSAVPVNPTTVKDVQVDAVKDFADAARHGFRNMSAGVPADGGYTVPEDIQTRINKYRDAEFSLRQMVTVENVTAPTGQRTYQKKSRMTGFTVVGEGNAVGKMAAPEFERVSYAVKKRGGVLPCTNELLSDSDANITAVITEWIGGQERATDNISILAAIKAAKEAEAVAISGIDDITKILNVTLGAAYKPFSKIVTNDNGLQFLQELKDANGRALLNPIPSEPGKLQIAAGATVIRVEVVPNEVLGNDSVESAEHIPFIIGDLSAVHLYDRNMTSIKVSDTASVEGFNAYEDDLTLFRAIVRTDVQVVDKDAIVYARVAVVG